MSLLPCFQPGAGCAALSATVTRTPLAATPSTGLCHCRQSTTARGAASRWSRASGRVSNAPPINSRERSFSGAAERSSDLGIGGAHYVTRARPSIPFVSISFWSSSSPPWRKSNNPFFSSSSEKERNIFTPAVAQPSFCVCLKSRPLSRYYGPLKGRLLLSTHYSDVCKFQCRASRLQ